MAGLTWNTVGSIIGVPIGFACLLYILLSHKKKKDVNGKVVLITGASSGLGEACAKLFYKAGCKVILAGRNRQKLQEVQEHLTHQKVTKSTTPAILEIDLENLQAIPDRVLEGIGIFGHVDILINNAGISYRGMVEDTDLDVHMKLMTVNYFAQVAVTEAVLKHMMTLGSGCIVGISSVQGKIAIPFRSAYAASKHAFQAFYDTLRAEVADSNINVTVISPAYIKTNLSHNALCGDGSKYGAMDKTTEDGMDPLYVAEQVMSAVIWQKDDVILAPFLYKIVIFIRTFLPALYFKIMSLRAKFGRKQFLKDK